MRIKLRAAAFMLAVSAAALSFASCSTENGNISQITDIAETVMPAETSEQLVRNAPAAYALANNFDGGAVDEPFSTYTYDFSVYDSNYLITVTPDENGTGLTLTVEDNQFGFSKFSVTPPDNYMVNLPYSQQYASQVCTVIKSSSEENSDIPDLLKIDFFLINFDDESLPYSVSRLYSILNGSLVEVEVYNTEGDYADGTVELSDNDSSVGVMARSVDVQKTSDILDRMNYIPESDLYRTESLKFMPEPIVTVNEDGSLSTEIITYTLNPNDMTMRRACETWTDVNDNPLYYGYAAHAVAGNIYQYFISTSLNVSDYENYVEVAASDNSDSRYFFKVDDPRFSTLTELRSYTLKYFDEKIVNEMFLKAPQQYRDIGGELYTILGDGGINEELGKLTITSWDIDGNTVTYHTKQEKFNSDHVLDGYVDGGDFVIEVSGGNNFIVKQYRYPNS